MGRKVQAKQNSRKRSGKEGNKFVQQRRKELSMLVDKLLKLTSIFQATGTPAKSWEHHLQIEAIIREILNIEAFATKVGQSHRRLNLEKYVNWLHEHEAKFDGNNNNNLFLKNLFQINNIESEGGT